MNYIYGLTDMKRPSTLYRSIASYAAQAVETSRFVLCCQSSDFDAVASLLSRLKLENLEIRTADPMRVLRDLIGRLDLNRLTFWDTSMQFHPWRLGRQTDFESSVISSCLWYFPDYKELYVSDLSNLPAPGNVMPGTLSLCREDCAPVPATCKSPLEYAVSQIKPTVKRLPEWHWAMYEVPRTTATYLRARELVVAPSSSWSLEKVKAARSLFRMHAACYHVPCDYRAPQDVAVCGSDGVGFYVPMPMSPDDLPEDTEKDWLDDSPTPASA